MSLSRDYISIALGWWQRGVPIRKISEINEFRKFQGFSKDYLEKPWNSLIQGVGMLLQR